MHTKHDKKMPDKTIDFLHLFQKVTKMITSTLDVEKVLDVIVQKVPEVLGVDAATIRLLDPSGERLLLVASCGLSKEYLNRGPIDAEKSVTKALAGTPVAIHDALSYPHIQHPEAIRKEGIKSILVAPIIMKGEISGVLRLLTKSPRHFKNHEIEFVAALAEQCGIAIENAGAYEEQNRQIQYLKSLEEIGKALNSTFQLQEVLDFIVAKIPEVMTLKGCTIRLIDPGKGHLELVASSGLSKEYLGRGCIDDELSTHQAMTGAPVIIHDATIDPRISFQENAKKEGVASILAVAIVVKKRIIGVLRLLTSEKRDFSDAEINFATAVAEQGGIAIQNAKNYGKITKLITELEQHEDFLQMVIDSLNAQLLVIDIDHHITMVNHAFLENHDLKEDDIIGKSCHQMVSICNLDDCPLKHIKQGEKTSACIRKIKKGPGEKYLEERATPVSAFGKKEGTDFIILTIRDVTAHIQLREEHRTKERLQGVLEMAGAAAHELNTPVFSALGTAQLLLDDLTESQMQNDLETIIRNLNSISELTRKMTRITKYEAKEYVGDVKIVDIQKASEDPTE
ncbi:MAG: GAF domain-containing protein [Desulfobacula sp.]|uniref:GAF domain-containing protein n=3 Tax=Desulfobacula sp. TaxID=2593537 RepID=UPI001D704EE4|nr:GAF domain-containing protein [Desulfobacula sp.]MBT3486515.1 GAF domain-containing protein [Desulfobacula sp.]MBT3806413.1 GAF domain-containing protein [Desulfobacula sp.]MBT4023919.1 GAF domain-containing protein [Desulfobacula sp.]MBT4875322.1 GAF domain-containing protein [Desulfobacula sp.]